MTPAATGSADPQHADVVVSSLQASRALIQPMMKLTEDAYEKARRRRQPPMRVDRMLSVVGGQNSAEERRRIRAERKVLKMNAEKELDVWGKVKRERYDLPEFCEYDEETFDHFESFCATRIQACWRMFAARQHYRRVRWAAMTIQRYWRVWGFVMRPKKRLLERSARSIQRAWRGFAQRRTFAQIRDVVRFKGSGDPAFLLRVLAPSEADFADEASGVHVRFRLGGKSWPPTIFYKIFTHRNVADIGAFAPRDYSHEVKVKQGKKRTGVKEPEEGAKDMALYDRDSRRRWYRRHENNGWRPLNEEAFGHMILAREAEDDGVDISALTANRSALKHKQRGGARRGLELFHPMRAERRAQKQMHARRRQYEWLQKFGEKVMVAKGVGTDTIGLDQVGGASTSATAAAAAAAAGRGGTAGHSREDSRAGCSGSAATTGSRPLSMAIAKRLQDDDEFLQDFMDEESDLLAWTTALDYEAYLSDWYCNATTMSSEARRNIGYESFVATCEAQERAAEFENSMNDLEGGESRSQGPSRQGAGSIASVYSEEDEDGYK